MLAQIKLNLCSTNEEKPFMATAEMSLNPVNDLDAQAKGTMKALVYHGHGKIAWDKPHPAIQHPGDAIVRLTTSTICGMARHRKRQAAILFRDD